MFDAFTRLPLRVGMHALFALMRLRWFVTRPAVHGAHAVAVTPEGRIVLVKLRYAGGWRAPGGAMKQGEQPAAAALRELREEIGMTTHGDVQIVCEQDSRVTFKRDRSTVFIVRDVRYQPRWNWEVEAVAEASLDALPPTLSDRTRSWIEQARPLLRLR